ncbi:hypothetical protein HN014_22160 (plasmid) [Aquimarina sp. TRL1]|uniref:hypothetical protein n=1 Tax=Aquimarina sp. (strain TRL1) TaxID=2736252 RepID=UPI00158BE8F0|nr:hypothetical protein [Aquimarina sp. TRL1]QKX07706.1 hypothetical protein HN014_22160 [Aquimarina sp. TRL1]
MNNLSLEFTKHRKIYLKSWASKLLNLDIETSSIFDIISINILIVLIDYKGFENIIPEDLSIKQLKYLSIIDKYENYLNDLNFDKLSNEQLNALIYPVRYYIEEPGRYYKDKHKLLISQ